VSAPQAASSPGRCAAWCQRVAGRHAVRAERGGGQLDQGGVRGLVTPRPARPGARACAGEPWRRAGSGAS
jgi:hypothetical protein